jgi:hypothetical protein
LGLYVAHGPAFETAQRRFWWKKQSSQLTFFARVRTSFTPRSSSLKLDLDCDHQSGLLPPPATSNSGNRKNFTLG